MIKNNNYFDIINQLGKYNSVICLNGNLEDPAFYLDLNLPIIAIDGAANYLNKININPQLIIGDLDSIDSSIFPNTTRIMINDQNFCDFEKALMQLEKFDLLPSIITGINGGYFDHILNNLAVFSKTNSIFLSNNQIGFVKQEKFSLNLPINTKISIFGLPNSKISSFGLKWELNHYHLDFFSQNSCFNRTIHENIQINIHTGKILIIMYLEQINDLGSL